MNRLMIFDLDGVLLETRQMHYETLNNALAYYGYSPISFTEHTARFNGRSTHTKLDMLGIVGAEAEEIKREKQRRTLAWVMNNVHRDESLVTLFTDLRAHGWQVAVASNAITVTVVRTLQLLGLWKLCNFIVAGDQITFPKPDPAIYRHCMEACGADPSTTWIVEDSPLGREGALRSGAHVVAVDNPTQVDVAVRRVMENA